MLFCMLSNTLCWAQMKTQKIIILNIFIQIAQWLRNYFIISLKNTFYLACLINVNRFKLSGQCYNSYQQLITLCVLLVFMVPICVYILLIIKHYSIQEEVGLSKQVFSFLAYKELYFNIAYFYFVNSITVFTRK